jgi:type IV secretion system protein VirB2
MKRYLRKLEIVLRVLVPVCVGLWPATAHAQGMPWEGPLANLIESLTGPVAKAIGIAAIVCLGIGIAFSEGGSMLRKALFVVFGLAVTFSAATWALPFLGFNK